MEWWIFAVAAVSLILFLTDWFIVMGIKPKNWKGGRKDGRNKRSGFDK